MRTHLQKAHGKLGRRPKKNLFNPDREFIQEAVGEYLKNGGTIIKTEQGENFYFTEDVDRFLVNPDHCGTGRLKSRNMPFDFSDEYYLNLPGND